MIINNRNYLNKPGSTEFYVKKRKNSEKTVYLATLEKMPKHHCQQTQLVLSSVSDVLTEFCYFSKAIKLNLENYYFNIIGSPSEFVM